MWVSHFVCEVTDPRKTRKRGGKSKEDSTMYLFPALSETHVVGKNEKACNSFPTFLFIHISIYVTLEGHPTF